MQVVPQLADLKRMKNGQVHINLHIYKAFSCNKHNETSVVFITPKMIKYSKGNTYITETSPHKSDPKFPPNK